MDRTEFEARRTDGPGKRYAVPAGIPHAEETDPSRGVRQRQPTA